MDKTRQDCVEVRRGAGTFALLGVGAWVVAAAYAWRAAAAAASPVTWLVVAALVMIGAAYLRAAWDARVALLVVDDHGVRARRGREWTGVPWDQIATVSVCPRAGLLQDGRVEANTADGASIVARVGVQGPVAAEDLAESLRELAPDTVEVRALSAAVPQGRKVRPMDRPVVVDETPASVESVRPDHAAASPAARMDPAPTAPTVAPTAARETSDADQTEYTDETSPRPRRLSAASPIRTAALASARRAIRANLTRTGPRTAGSSALKDDPATHELPEIATLMSSHQRSELVFDRVTALAPTVDVGPAVAVDAAPVEAWPTQAAADPVIGNQLREARERLGLTVDALAARTRIRPHVIEAIEVDDFTPCGGDFYARGHLRSLARVLGLDGAPLATTYDETYAQAPIEARKVFQAELATGPKPSIRLTSGGPNWTALIGVVLVIAIVWGLGNLLTGRDQAPATTPVVVPPTGQAATPGAPVAPTRPTTNAVVLRGTGADTRVVVRDTDGARVWRGVLGNGDVKRLSVDGRARISSADGGAVQARVNGKAKGDLGAAGKPARATLGRA